MTAHPDSCRTKVKYTRNSVISATTSLKDVRSRAIPGEVTFMARSAPGKLLTGFPPFAGMTMLMPNDVGISPIPCVKSTGFVNSNGGILYAKMPEPFGPIFHEISWLKILCACFGVILLVWVCPFDRSIILTRPLFIVGCEPTVPVRSRVSFASRINIFLRPQKTYILHRCDRKQPFR